MSIKYHQVFKVFCRRIPADQHEDVQTNDAKSMNKMDTSSNQLFMFKFVFWITLPNGSVV